MDKLIYDFTELCNSESAVIHCNLKLLQELFNISEDVLKTLEKEITTGLEGVDPMDCDCLFLLYWPYDEFWAIKLIYSSKNKITDTKLIDDITAFFSTLLSGDSYTKEFQEKINNLTNKTVNKIVNKTLNISETEFIKPLKLFK